MPTMRLGFVAAFAIVAFCSPPLLAQESDQTTVSFTVSPSYIHFGGVGGGFGAAVAQLRVTRSFGTQAGAELTFFALVPGGAAATEPLCVPGGVCHSSQTPSALNGAIGSGYRVIGETGFRLGLGAGAVWASGGQGPYHKSSFAGLAGLDWESRGHSDVRPTIGVRYVVLARPVYGARHVLVPGFGFVF